MSKYNNILQYLSHDMMIFKLKPKLKMVIVYCVFFLLYSVYLCHKAKQKRKKVCFPRHGGKFWFVFGFFEDLILYV